jgi:hypothetical protein
MAIYMAKTYGHRNKAVFYAGRKARFNTDIVPRSAAHISTAAAACRDPDQAALLLGDRPNPSAMSVLIKCMHHGSW